MFMWQGLCNGKGRALMLRRYNQSTACCKRALQGYCCQFPAFDHYLHLRLSAHRQTVRATVQKIPPSSHYSFYNNKLFSFSVMSTDEEEEAAEDAASRWREGVLEDAGASSSFASVFNLDTKVRQSSATLAAVRQHWSPAASQVFVVAMALLYVNCMLLILSNFDICHLQSPLQRDTLRHMFWLSVNAYLRLHMLTTHGWQRDAACT